MPFSPRTPLEFNGVAPANPTGIANAAYKMCGLGVAGANAWVLTPQVTGRVLIFICGDLNSDATGQTATLQCSFGTGTAPVNGAGVAGTQQGAQPTWVSLTGLLQIPFSMSTIVTGQTVGTPLWFDLAAKSSAGTVSLTNLNAWALEI